MHWIIPAAVVVAVGGGYAWLFVFARRRQKKFEAQYAAAKERHEVFVLNKKIVREHGQSRWTRFYKFKTYQITGKVTLSQAMRGMQVSRMQTVSLRTTKQEYEKVQPSHRYKMDVAGNYIGFVVAPLAPKGKSPATRQGTVVGKATSLARSFLRRRSPEQNVAVGKGSGKAGVGAGGSKTGKEKQADKSKRKS